MTRFPSNTTADDPLRSLAERRAVKAPRFEPGAEVTLLKRLHAGDESAYEALVRAYGAGLLATARRLVSAEDEARDVLTEAFSAAFKTVPFFAGEGGLSLWLHRHLLNAIAARWRREAVSVTPSVDHLLAHFDAHGGHARGVDAWEAPNGVTALDDGEIDRVRAVLSRLPLRHRAAFILRDVEGLASQDTARLLQRPVGEVDRLLREARQALRTLLATGSALTHLTAAVAVMPRVTQTSRLC
jgi:RNA polymerase sigma-70 factor (ECF subfamily)